MRTADISRGNLYYSLYASMGEKRANENNQVYEDKGQLSSSKRTTTVADKSKEVYQQNNEDKRRDARMESVTNSTRSSEKGSRLNVRG